jgi:hypothetical protein
VRSIRFFSISILRSSVSRAFYVFFASFSAAFAAFSRATSSRAAMRSASFLIFLFAASRAFFSRAIVCCSFLSAAVYFYWNSVFSSVSVYSRVRTIFAELKNKIYFFYLFFL